jgi:hypothetical protein
VRLQEELIEEAIFSFRQERAKQNYNAGYKI